MILFLSSTLANSWHDYRYIGQRSYALLVKFDMMVGKEPPSVAWLGGRVDGNQRVTAYPIQKGWCRNRNVAHRISAIAIGARHYPGPAEGISQLLHSWAGFTTDYYCEGHDTYGSQHARVFYGARRPKRMAQ